MDQLKKDIRKVMTEKRDKISVSEKAHYDQSIFEKLKCSSFYENSKTVFIYVSFRSEVDTIRIINDLLSNGKTVCVPKVNRDKKEMEAYRINSIEDLQKGYFGILEPRASCKKVENTDIDLVLMPGLAFDRTGGRVGYGGGFYDRFLKTVNPGTLKIALAYHFQVLDEVPMEPCDIKIDGILTDDGLITKNKF